MEQIYRAQRYLDRLREVYGGVVTQCQDNQRHEDDLRSFFMHCYHIRDWILHLNRVGVTQPQLDAFINGHEALRVCADLCNGSKHCRLTRRARSGLEPHVARRTYRSSVWLTGTGGSAVVKGEYLVKTALGFVDALELAEECMRLWRGFVDDMEHFIVP